MLGIIKRGCGAFLGFLIRTQCYLWLLVGWVIGAIVVAFALSLSPGIRSEVLETIAVRVSLGMVMALCMTTFVVFLDLVTDGWWAEKVGENPYASALVYCTGFVLMGSAMRLY